MVQPTISGSSRIRRTPYSQRVEEAGVKSYTVYNHMLLATVFETLEYDYSHLKKAVQVWDVSCLLYTSPSPRDRQKSRMPSSA